jgi:hypothetical protein
MQIRVDCHAGYRGEETPRGFWLGQRRVAVVEVLDRWLAPDHRYFKILADDGGIYILRHDPARDCWQMTLYRQSTLGPTAPGGHDDEAMA